MNNIYDVFNDEHTKPQQQERKPRLSKEEYAQMMKEKRQALFNMANEQTFKAVENPDQYLQYLKLINTVITPPIVSIPNDNGVTSSNNTSLTSPAITPP